MAMLNIRATSSKASVIAARRSQSLLSRYTVRTLSTTGSQDTVEDYDVVIVGGGPAGLALASALGSTPLTRHSLRVTLVEGGDLDKIREWNPQPQNFSNRVSSLTNASQMFLRGIGAWSQVDDRRTLPVEEMQVWDGVSDARITFSASDLGAANLIPGQMARLTENLNLQRGLLRHLDGIPEIRILQKTRVSSIGSDAREHGGKWPLVHLDNGRTFRARLLVGADGFNSPVRSYAGISSYGWAYDTQAVVATMNHAPRGAFQGPNTTAYQRFLPTGPIAFLPISPTASSLVWSTKPQLASALIVAGPEVAASMINAAFRLPEVSMRYLHSIILNNHHAGKVTTHSEISEEILWRERSHSIDSHSPYASAAVDSLNAGVPISGSDSLPPLVTSLQPGTIASFPLRYNHADAYIGEGPGSRTVLAGDAAHTIHPLAGQGLNMGLADVQCLARCIHDATLYGGDIGSYTALLPYGQERYIENHKIMAAVDKLHKLYSTTFEPAVWARSVGLEVLNEFDAIKGAIMTTAGARNSTSRSSQGWDIAAATVEGLSSSVKVAKLVGTGVGGLLANGLQGLANTISSAQRQ